MKDKIKKDLICNLFLGFIIMATFFNCVSGKSLMHNSLVHQKEGVDILTAGLDSKLVFFTKSKNFEKMCMAPPQDAYLNASNKVSLAYENLGQKDGVSEQSGVGVTSLGGRSPALLIARELMYRACELSVNHRLSKKEAIDLYLKFLKSVESIALKVHDKGLKGVNSLQHLKNEDKK